MELAGCGRVQRSQFERSGSTDSNFPVVHHAGPPGKAAVWWLKWRQVRAAAVLHGSDVRYRLAMEFVVVPIYSRGVRLGRSAVLAAKPVPGLLVIEDRLPENDMEPVLRVARFRHADARVPELLLPLSDPVLLRCDRRGVLLGGFEEAESGDGARVAQAWWLRPVPEDDGAPHLRRSDRRAR